MRLSAQVQSIDRVEQSCAIASGNPTLDLACMSSVMQGIAGLAERLAKSEARTILLQGETGVGKDKVANDVHQMSRRSGFRFLAVNCAAIPEMLFESELFGHERGAFTDARTSKPGLMEVANRGTLFLDEISQMPLRIQGKLLRVLEDGGFRRLGGVGEVHADIRFIAATNVDLAEAVRLGTFRADLFYRLNAFEILIPPLRDRIDDIVPLAMHFLKKFNALFNRQTEGFSNAAIQSCLRYSWPGNVRELRNVVERAMVIEQSPLIQVESLPARVCGSTRLVCVPTEDLSLMRSERRLLIRALEISEGNQVRAAGLLDISRDAVRYKIRKHGLSGS